MSIRVQYNYSLPSIHVGLFLFPWVKCPACETVWRENKQRCVVWEINDKWQTFQEPWPGFTGFIVRLSLRRDSLEMPEFSLFSLTNFADYRAPVMKRDTHSLFLSERRRNALRAQNHAVTINEAWIQAIAWNK